MKIFQSALEAGRWAPGAVAVIGKFDGIHRGHRKLIRRALRCAKNLDTRCIVLTFDPSPEQFLGIAVRPILPLAERLVVLEGLGVDGVVLLPFNGNLACLAPEAFAKNVLAEQLQVKDVYVGEDFCFGKDRAGRVEALVALGRTFGFRAHPVPLLHMDGEKVTASRIRRLLAEGRQDEAERLLGWKLPRVEPRASPGRSPGAAPYASSD